MFSKPSYYKIADDKVWDIENACYTTEYDASKTLTLYNDGAVADEAYLKKTLKFYGYVVGDVLLTDDECAAMAREKRAELLQATDWYVLPDYPADESALARVKEYRQALRDITEQEGFPREIDWPELPSLLASK